MEEETRTENLHSGNINQLLAERIHTLRTKQGCSQEEMADKLNVVRQTVARWEQGTASPSVENLLPCPGP